MGIPVVPREVRLPITLVCIGVLIASLLPPHQVVIGAALLMFVWGAGCFATAL